ncbi:MAG: leucine--tRNA ligase [Candidatus Andersenbacteria bacterium]
MPPKRTKTPKSTKKASKKTASPKPTLLAEPRPDSERYDPSTIEPKWQKIWADAKIFVRPDKAPKKGAKKMYVLDMFPYPSGDGLHVGHVESYTASDILARYYRAQGYTVLHPMGWDSFGLPAENYALKTGVHPRITTKKNIDNFRRQMQRLGFSYDWSREVTTSDPTYYKWTQWIFVQLFKQGLAYEAEVAINWCPKDKTGLANEEVVNGCCDRCGTPVVKKNLRQWLLRITKYADRLLADLDGLDWPHKITEQQRNWIGKSEGVEVEFALESSKSVSVFTTRADTLFGVTYIVLAPEHGLARAVATGEHRPAVLSYIDKAIKRPERDRTTAKKKTGVFTGAYAINPINSAKVPIWVADYVLAGYGTGAVMAVPAHDDRDFEFATTYKLPINVVVEPDAAGSPQTKSLDSKLDKKLDGGQRAFVADGRLVNSGEFTGLGSDEARKKIAASLTKQKKGRVTTHYKLRDWVFSRQRYWGEPIPIIHCPDHGAVAVPEDQLPVKLPEVEKYQPTGTGESPLAAIDEWVKTTCPTCGKPAKRETNTMPQWAGSSWYFLRFPDPHNDQAAWTKDSLKWLPVDLYIGGAEHAVLHLLYARFWIKALKNAGHLSFDEPFTRLRNQGIILAPDGTKMSKSKGNVINPDDVIKHNGADALRLFEMFLGPLEQQKSWSTEGIAGLVRFLERVWRLQDKVEPKAKPDAPTTKQLHITTRVVTKHIEGLRFNTAISALMQFTNTLTALKVVPTTAYQRLLVLLAPFAPHLTEELWSRLPGTSSKGKVLTIQAEPWPTADQTQLTSETVTLVVQVNGKFRGRLTERPTASQAEVQAAALKVAAVKRALAGHKPRKVIFVPGKIINLLI